MKWILVIFLLTHITEGQVMRQSTPQKKIIIDHSSSIIEQRNTQVLEVIRKIEDGIRIGMIDKYTNEFAPMVSIVISIGERGTFSTNQAVSILSNYFSGRHVISFKFSRIDDKKKAPYATGRLVYIRKGNQESVQIYISLTLQDSRWVITQFNIY